MCLILDLLFPKEKHYILHIQLSIIRQAGCGLFSYYFIPYTLPSVFCS